MQKSKILTLITIMCLLTACSETGSGAQGNETAAPEETATAEPETAATTEPEETTETGTEEVDADITMENFVKKLEAGNYVIDAKDYVKTVAVSPEQVYFVHKDSTSSLNRAFVTLDGETFELSLEEDAASDPAFISKENAIDALTYLLPNNWITISDDNMFNLFYNNVDDPLEFTSHDENVKTTLLGLGGYGQMALSQMEDVHMLLDKADPSSVRFTAVINDVPAARIYYDDLDLTLQFDAGETDPRIEKWISAPTYPETRTEWSIYDVAALDNVFLRGYGTLAVPFPSFTSYAMNFDSDAYMERSEILLTDAHGTEEDLENYKKVLLDQGYEEATRTLEDGSTEDVYRLLLREDYNAYAELDPHYDNGFVLVGRMYYDSPVYDSQTAISDAAEKYGFAALDETDLFEGWNATDSAAPRSEGWLYFFDYNLYLPVQLQYSDFDAAKAYLEDYGNKLQGKGFSPVYTPDENGGQYEFPNGFTSFTYYFDDEDLVTLVFKAEKSLTAEEARKVIADRGIPEPDLSGEISTRDLTRYYYNLSGFQGLFLDVTQPFATAEDAEKFLDAYVAVLEEAGYEYDNPQRVGSYRNFLYLNEETGKHVAFDFNRGDDQTNIFFEFVSRESGDETILQSALGN